MARRNGNSRAAGPAVSGPRTRRKWSEWVVVATALLVGVSCLVAAVALFLVDRGASDLRRISVGESLTAATAADAGAVNVLLTGLSSDTPAGSPDPLDVGALDAGQTVAIAMVLRVDPTAEAFAMLSIPSTTPLTADGGGSTVTVASSVRERGPAGLLDGVQATLGIPIHRYVSVALADVEPLVDSLGGFPVFVPYPLRDADGLITNRNGCVVVDGASAARYLGAPMMEGELPDRGWVELESVGMPRVARDRDALASLLGQIPGGWPEARRSAAAALAAADVFVVDDGAARNDLLDLVNQAARWSDDLYAFDLPVPFVSGEGDPSTEEAAVLGVFRSDPAGLAAAEPLAWRPGTATLRSTACQ